MELSQLYLKTNNFVGAQFCMEELILSNPYNHIYHQRYAEVGRWGASTLAGERERHTHTHARARAHTHAHESWPRVPTLAVAWTPGTPTALLTRRTACAIGAVYGRRARKSLLGAQVLCQSGQTQPRKHARCVRRDAGGRKAGEEVNGHPHTRAFGKGPGDAQAAVQRQTQRRLARRPAKASGRRLSCCFCSLRACAV